MICGSFGFSTNSNAHLSGGFNTTPNRNAKRFICLRIRIAYCQIAQIIIIHITFNKNTVDTVDTCQKTIHLNTTDTCQAAAVRPGDYFLSIDGCNCACTEGYLIGSCCSTIGTDSDAASMFCCNNSSSTNTSTIFCINLTAGTKSNRSNPFCHSCITDSNTRHSSSTTLIPNCNTITHCCYRGFITDNNSIITCKRSFHTQKNTILICIQKAGTNSYHICCTININSCTVDTGDACQGTVNSRINQRHDAVVAACG